MCMYIYTHIYMYIYIYIYMRVCVCVCAYKGTYSMTCEHPTPSTLGDLSPTKSCCSFCFFARIASTSPNLGCRGFKSRKHTSISCM